MTMGFPGRLLSSRKQARLENRKEGWYNLLQKGNKRVKTNTNTYLLILLSRIRSRRISGNRGATRFVLFVSVTTTKIEAAAGKVPTAA